MKALNKSLSKKVLAMIIVLPEINQSTDFFKKRDHYQSLIDLMYELFKENIIASFEKQDVYSKEESLFLENIDTFTNNQEFADCNNLDENEETHELLEEYIEDYLQYVDEKMLISLLSEK